MVSVTVPFSVILLTANRYEYSIWAGVVVGCLWCVLVSTSRLYLGMHSLAVRLTRYDYIYSPLLIDS